MKRKIWILAMMIMIITTATAYARPASEPPKLIAHMGLSAKAPMNTMAAFREAAAAGCYGIETDIRMTADGEVVCFHDAKLDSTTNGSGSIRNTAYEDLEDVRYTKADGLKRYPDENIPAFHDFVLECAENGCLGVIDCKWTKDYRGLLDEAHRILEQRGMLDYMVFQCGSEEYIRYLNEEYGDTRTWLLLDNAITERDVRIAERYGCECINTNKVSEDAIGVAHEAGVEVCCYSVNTKKQMDKYMSWDIDYIMTDGYDEKMLHKD